MNSTERILGMVVLIVVALIAVFFTGQCSKKCPPVQISTKTKTDTIIVYQQLEPDTFTVVKPRIVYRDHWVTDTLTFEKLRDTIFTAVDEFVTSRKDTVHSEFLFPEIQFNHKINYAKDSIKTIIQTITVEKVTIEPRPWWEKPLYIIAGVGAGYLIGKAK